MIEAGILNTMALRMADQLNSRHGLLFLLDQNVDATELKNRMRTDDQSTLLDHLYSISPACIDVVKTLSVTKPNILMGLAQTATSYFMGKEFIVPDIEVSRREGTSWIADTVSNMLAYKPDYATPNVNTKVAAMGPGAQRSIWFGSSEIAAGVADKFTLWDQIYINHSCDVNSNVYTRRVSNSTYANKRDIASYLQEFGYIEDRTVNTITVRFGYPDSASYKPKWTGLNFRLYAFDEATSMWTQLVSESNLVEGFLTFNFESVTAKRFRYALDGNFGADYVNQAEIYLNNLVFGTTEHTHVPKTYNIDKAVFLPYKTGVVPAAYPHYFDRPNSVPCVLLNINESSGIQLQGSLEDGAKFNLVAPSIQFSEMYLSDGMKHLMLSVITNAISDTNTLSIISIHLFEGPVPNKSELDNLYFDNVSNYTVTNAHTRLNIGSRKLLGSASAALTVGKAGISSNRINQRCFHFNTDMNITASGTASFALITLDRSANVSASLMIASIGISDADIGIKDVNVVAGSAVSLGDISIDYFEEDL